MRLLRASWCQLPPHQPLNQRCNDKPHEAASNDHIYSEDDGELVGIEGEGHEDGGNGYDGNEDPVFKFVGNGGLAVADGEDHFSGLFLFGLGRGHFEDVPGDDDNTQQGVGILQYLEDLHMAYVYGRVNSIGGE